MIMVVNVVSVSGTHVYQESGAVVVVASGTGVTVQSGVFFASGVGVTVQSGLGVWISGQHVYVESGVYTIANVNGYYYEQQYWTPIRVDRSGRLMSTVSGDHVYVESGAWVITKVDVTVSSGLHVVISGQHVYVESGVYLASGMAVLVSGQAMMVGRSGVVAGIDLTARTLNVITYEHHEIHEGDMWHGYIQTSGLADDASLNTLIVTGSGLEVHAIFEKNVGGDAWWELYEGVLLSGSPGGSGTPVTLHCMNRYVSGMPQSTAFHNPNYIGGTKLAVEFMPGGTGPRAGGGGARGEQEWVLTGVSGPVNYLLRVVNVAAAAKDITVGVEFYEKRPGY